MHTIDWMVGVTIGRVHADSGSAQMQNTIVVVWIGRQMVPKGALVR